MAIYMKYGDVTGDATQKGFEDLINIDHFHWEVNRAVVKQPAGRGTTREAKKPELGPFDVTKDADSASTGLLYETCCKSKPMKCEISFVRTGEEKAYMTYTFYEALITKITTATGGDGRQAEVVTFDFTAVEAMVYPIEKDNQRGDPSPFPYFRLFDDK